MSKSKSNAILKKSQRTRLRALLTHANKSLDNVCYYAESTHQLDVLQQLVANDHQKGHPIKTVKRRA
jgi:hypothetical protein